MRVVHCTRPRVHSLISTRQGSEFNLRLNARQHTAFWRPIARVFVRCLCVGSLHRYRQASDVFRAQGVNLHRVAIEDASSTDDQTVPTCGSGL